MAPKTTGKFKDRGNLETVVLYLRVHKTMSHYLISRKCGVSKATVRNICCEYRINRPWREAEHYV